MRRRRVGPRGSASVRDAYALHLRAQYEHRPVLWRHFARRVEEVEAGASLVLQWWELAPFMPGIRHPDRRGGSRFVRLEPDGSATFVEPVRDGNEITDWASIA